MRRLFGKIDANFEPIMIIGLFYSLLTLLVVQIFLRKFAQGGFPWAEEVCRFMFVWLMYFCISYATRNQRHIKVRFLIQQFNEKTQKVVAILTDLLFLCFTVIMLVATTRIVQSAAHYGDKAISLNISMNFLYVAGLVGMFLMTMRVLQGIWWKFKNWNESLERFENVFGVYYDGAMLLPFLSSNGTNEIQEEAHQGKGSVDK